MTYSISARCPESGAFGIAITSSSIAVPRAAPGWDLKASWCRRT